MLQALLENPKKKQMAKGAVLLGSWRKLLKSCNVDGMSHLFPVDAMQKWSRIEKDAIECFDFSEVLVMVVSELPEIRNKPKRVGAAKSYAAQQKGRSYGSDVDTRLSQLCSGWAAEDAAAKADAEVALH